MTRLTRAAILYWLIADEWANAPGEMLRFAQAKAAHAIQIEVPDNGSLSR